jgi:flagella basal body P-ring formation protein FlgA
MIRVFLISILCAIPAMAEVYSVTHVIRPGQVIAADDLTVLAGQAGPDLQPTDIIGREAGIVLYPGRAISADALRAPAMVDRNALVDLIFYQGTLKISVAGRSLGRAAQGELVQVMNLASRKIVVGVAHNHSQVVVSR